MKPILTVLLPLFLSTPAFAQKTVGGYTVGTWHTAQSDSTVQFKLAQNPAENCVMYVMETTLDAPPQKVLSPIADYAKYTSMGMPRMYKSNLLHHTDQSSLNFVMGKQRKFSVSVSQAETDIVQFSLSLPWLPDNHYTLLLSTFYDPETEIIHVYWIQYDNKNYATISGSWLTEVPAPMTKNFWGSSVFDTKTYPNSNEDIYGSWTLTTKHLFITKIMPIQVGWADKSSTMWSNPPSKTCQKLLLSFEQIFQKIKSKD